MSGFYFKYNIMVFLISLDAISLPVIGFYNLSLSLINNTGGHVSKYDPMYVEVCRPNITLISDFGSLKLLSPR